MTQIRAQAPGKLYLAGEYAVVTPYYSAIGMAVNRFITVTIEPAKTGSFFSKGFSKQPLSWQRLQGRFTLKSSNYQLATVVIQTVEQYVSEKGNALAYYALTIESSLTDKSGRKYGLGSSGALTVALVKALLMFYHIPLDKELIFKLAALSHLRFGDNGSLGDLAISTFGGCIVYTNFDRSQFNLNQSLHSLLNQKWPGLKIDTIHLPPTINWLVGWTGLPISTSLQVDKVYTKKKLAQQEFLQKSQTIVADLKETKDTRTFLAGIHANRHLLQQLAASKDILIETPALTAFIVLAEQFGGQAKTSGAGGGDCGIAFFDHKIDLQAFDAALAKEHIDRLDLRLAY